MVSAALLATSVSSLAAAAPLRRAGCSPAVQVVRNASRLQVSAAAGSEHFVSSSPSQLDGRVSRLLCRAETAEADMVTISGGNGVDPQSANIPMPTIKIDNDTDKFATIVCIGYGDRLGELLDTVAALKNLNLNVRRAKIGVNDRGSYRHKFYITEAATSEKILKSQRLEEIRLTILNNLLLFHPESGEELAWGLRAKKADSSMDVPLGVKSHRAVETVITIDGGEEDAFSKLFIKTQDRPGLLVEIVKVLKDINVNVISAEVDTQGKTVLDSFYVTYHGEPLNQSMCQLVTNALQYYLSLNAVEREESY